MMRDILARLNQLEESQTNNEGPQIGDEFGLSFSEDLEISTTIVDMLEDGFVVQMDDNAMMHMQENGITFLEGEVVEEEIKEGEQHGNSKIYNKCWKGYRKVPGKKRGEEGSCVKEGNYEQSEKAKQFAEIGRKMMDKGSSMKLKDDEAIDLSNKLGRLGDELTNFDDGTGVGGWKTLDQLMKKVDMDKDEIMKLIDMSKDVKDPLHKVRDPDPVEEPEEESIERIKSLSGMDVDEAEYRGRKVSLGKPTRGDVKKFKVYVKNPKGNVVKVNFGDPNMKIKKSNPARRKSFRARHNCDNPGPRHKARYWSCRKW